MGEASDDDTTAAQPRRERLVPSRKKRHELIRQNRKRVAEAAVARHQPGSNAPPPPTAAKIDAYWGGKRADVAAILDRAQITHPGERLILQEVLLSARNFQGGGNVMRAALWALRTVVRSHEQPGSLLRELDAWAHEATRVAAIREILDRGYGRATQPLSGEDGTSPIQLHLLAARSTSDAAALLEKPQRQPAGSAPTD